jgi:hypothetical protein
MDFTYDEGMPLGDLMRGIDELLEKQARVWLEQKEMPVPASEQVGVPAVSVPPAVRDQLKVFYLAQFCLAVGGQLDYHARASLERARFYGATYTELGRSIGMTRQGIQRRWGVTDEERDAALQAVADAVDTLPPPLPTLPEVRWRTKPLAHNYDREAPLSAALVSVEGGTGSSPNQVLLFRRGKYLGPVTDIAYGFTDLVLPMSKDNMVAVQFKLPGSDHAGPSAAIYTARFTWRDERLLWFGELLPGATSSIAECGYKR